MKRFKLGNKGFRLLFLTIVGSELHRLNTESSDTDLKGVIVWDEDVQFGLEDVPTVIDRKRTNNTEWSKFIGDFNQEFGFNLTINDDLDLFDIKQFFLLSIKNDFNMLDMLFSDKIIFCDGTFNNVIESRQDFINIKNAKSRFIGMANQAFKNFFVKETLFKDGSRSVQFLLSLKHLLKTGTHSPFIVDDEINKVLSIKKGEKTFNEVKVMFDSELNECQRLFKQINSFTQLDMNKLNTLLVETVKRTISF